MTTPPKDPSHPNDQPTLDDQASEGPSDAEDRTEKTVQPDEAAADHDADANVAPRSEPVHESATSVDHLNGDSDEDPRPAEPGRASVAEDRPDTADTADTSGPRQEATPRENSTTLGDPEITPPSQTPNADTVGRDDVAARGRSDSSVGDAAAGGHGASAVPSGIPPGMPPGTPPDAPVLAEKTPRAEESSAQASVLPAASGPSGASNVAPEAGNWLTDTLKAIVSAVSQTSKWVPTTLLLVLAIVSTWMVRQFEDAPPPGRVERVEEPDYFVENFTTTTTDETGALIRKLSATQLLHFPDTDTNELTNPHLVLYHPERTPWNIVSERGWVSASGDVVLLLGKVHAWRDDEVGVRLIDIRTRDMRILAKTEYGETDKPVVIRTRKSETHGVGMRSYLTESRVELLAQVTTVYEKKDPKSDAAPN